MSWVHLRHPGEGVGGDLNRVNERLGGRGVAIYITACHDL